MSTLGKELAVARILKGKTQGELAREAGIPQSELSKVERGHYLPNPELERRLKEVYGWTEEIASLCANGRHADQYVRSA